MTDNIYERIPTFGDHKLVIMSVFFELPKIELVIKRDWRNYTVEKLNSRLENYKMGERY
jgi:hypothetical protein